MHTNPTSVVTFLECKWCCQNAALSLFVNIILQEGRLCNSLTFDALFPPFVQIFSLLAGKFQGRAWQGIYYFDFSDSWAQQTFGASERLCCCVGGGFTKLFRFIKWVNSVKSFKSWRSIASPSLSCSRFGPLKQSGIWPLHSPINKFRDSDWNLCRDDCEKISNCRSLPC